MGLTVHHGESFTITLLFKNHKTLIDEHGLVYNFVLYQIPTCPVRTLKSFTRSQKKCVIESW